MFDRWTEKYRKIIRLSEDLTVGIPIQLVNKPVEVVVDSRYIYYIPFIVVNPNKT